MIEPVSVTHTVKPVKQRLVSLDVFRGLTIIFMIIVNNPGNPRAVYTALEHAAWHGFTPTDLVFPSFLFISGVSIVFALSARKSHEGLSMPSFRQILRRGFLLILIGIVIHSIPPRWQWSTFNISDYFSYMRFPGVLQRTGLVYIFAASFFLLFSKRAIFWIAFGFLVIYYLLMQFVPVPGIAPANFEPALNLEAYLDRLIIGSRHLYHTTYFWDPEGLLSTIPSISSALFGIFAGYTLKDDQKPAMHKLNWLFISGLIYLAIGILWSFVFPINKNLWSSSFVLVTVGLASLLLGICYYLVDIRKQQSGIKPFLYFGMNSILAYSIAETLETLLNYIYLPGPTEKPVGPFTFIYLHIFEPLPISAESSSAFWSICYVILFIPLLAYFYRKKIFLKV